MTPLTPETIRAATETLSLLTDYLRENPDPEEAFALAEPLLDEYTGLPVQFADTLRALARALQDHPDVPAHPGRRPADRRAAHRRMGAGRPALPSRRARRPP